MTTPLTGGCLCGAIRYTVSAPITELRACHCTSCQKASGAAGSVGSPIYSQRATTPEMLALRAGTLDECGGMKITANIWTRSARPWAYIDPASKQFPGQPDAPAAKN